MKKFISIIVVAFATSWAASAQFSCSLGPAMGANINFYTGDFVGNDPYRGVGFSLAGHADMKFTPVVGMLATLGYDNMNASYSEEQNNESRKTTFNIAYFTINPMLKFTVPSTGLYFVVGPGVGFNIQAKATQKLYQNGTLQGTQKISIKSMNTRFEARFGLGYNFELGDLIELAPQLTFGYGVNKVRESSEWKIMNLQLALACKFKL